MRWGMLLALTALGLTFGLALSLVLGSYGGAPERPGVPEQPRPPSQPNQEGGEGFASREEHGLRFELRAVVIRADTLPPIYGILICLTVVNVGEEEVELWFGSGQAWDVVIRDMAGRELWRWSADKFFTQAVWSERLEPGEEMRFSTEWRAPRAGRYVVVGYFMGRLGGLDGPGLSPISTAVEVS